MSITRFTISCETNSLYNSNINTNIVQHASTHDTTRHGTSSRGFRYEANYIYLKIIFKTAETILLDTANKAAMCISFSWKTKFVGNGAACTEQGTDLPTAGTKYTSKQFPTCILCRQSHVFI